MTSQRLFEILASVSSAPAASSSSASSPRIFSYLRTTTYADITSSQVELALPEDDDVQLMEYDYAAQRLLVIVRNAAGGATLLLKQLDPTSTSTSTIATTVLNLASTPLDQQQLVSGLSAWDPVRRTLFALVMTPSSANSGVSTFGVVSTQVPFSASASVDGNVGTLDNSVVSVEGMAWLPSLSRCLLVSYAGAWTYDPIARVLTEISTVASTLASFTTSSTVLMSAFTTNHVWSSVASSSTIPVPFSELVSSGLATAYVAASTSEAPMLMLMNAVTGNVRMLSSSDAISAASAAVAGNSTGSQRLSRVDAVIPSTNVGSFTPTSLSPAGGVVTIMGGNFSSLSSIPTGALQCTWSDSTKPGVVMGVSNAMILNSSYVSCTVSTIASSVQLLSLNIKQWNESLPVGTIDINQCLVGNGGCVGRALCVHTFGSNTCSYSTCSDATPGSGCTCLAGYYSSTHTIRDCGPCGGSTYKVSTGFDECTPCPTYAVSPYASFTSSSCICLAGFTQSASMSDGQFCTQPDRTLPKDVPVLMSFAVQSKWVSAVPPMSDASLQGRNPFQAAFLADLTNALGIDASRLSIIDVVAEQELSQKLNASTTGIKGIYVTVSFHIEPVTLSNSVILDSARDADGLAYSPTILGHFLEQMLEDTNSAVYQGTYTSTALASSLQVQSEAAVVEEVPFTKSAAFTAILLAAAIVIVLLLSAVIWMNSPDKKRVFDVATALLAVFTFVTSVIFISSLPNKGYHVAYGLSIFFMAVPTAINLVVVCKMVIKQRNNTNLDGPVWKKGSTEPVQMTFDDWLIEAGDFNYLLCVVMLISLISIDCLALITSQIWRLTEFSAPWTELQHEVQFWGILGVLFKTVPQLGIQIFVIQHEHQWTSLQVLSVSGSAIAVALGLCVRSIAYLVRWTRDKNKTQRTAKVGQTTELAVISSPTMPQVSTPKSKETSYGNWTTPIPGQAQIDTAQLERGPPGGHLMHAAESSFAMGVNH